VVDLTQGDRRTIEEDFLPIQKAACHFMSRKQDPQVLIEAEMDMLPNRMEPNSSSF
jgi:hypothetical protein